MSDGIDNMGMIHTCLHEVVHTHTHTRPHTRTQAQTHTHTHTHSRTHTHTHTHAHTHTRTRSRKHSHAHTDTYAHTHTNVCRHFDIYTYASIQVPFLALTLPLVLYVSRERALTHSSRHIFLTSLCRLDATSPTRPVYLSLANHSLSLARSLARALPPTLSPTLVVALAFALALNTANRRDVNLSC